MANFEAVYTQEQRDAIARAYVERGIKPAARIVQLAVAGQLENGLEPFTIRGGTSTVHHLVRVHRRRVSGAAAKEKLAATPQDSLDALRNRLFAVASEELEVEERKRKGRRDPEKLRTIARAVREAAALPTSVSTPAKDHAGATTTPERPNSSGPVAGPLLTAHRIAPRDRARTAPQPRTPKGAQDGATEATAENTSAEALPDVETPETGHGSEPGSPSRADFTAQARAAGLAPLLELVANDGPEKPLN